MIVLQTIASVRWLQVTVCRNSSFMMLSPFAPEIHSCSRRDTMI